MNDIAQQHRQALEATRTTVAGVKADQWAAPTPNEGWDVRALVNHIVSGNLWVVELVAGRTIEEVGDRLDGDVLREIQCAPTTPPRRSPRPLSRRRERWTRRARCPTGRCRDPCMQGTV